jgi:predicted Na+-dependent transporter
LEIFIFPDIFSGVPLKLYAADFVLPIIGLALGYIIASMFCLKPRISRTIAIEIGIKNVGTALTIVSLSFPFEVLPNFYFFLITSFFFVLIMLSFYSN